MKNKAVQAGAEERQRPQPGHPFVCVTCETLKAKPAPVRVPCALLSCEARQRATGKTLCAALELNACARKADR